LEAPEIALSGHSGVFVGRPAFGVELNLESAGGVRVRIQEAGVTLFEDVAKFGIARSEENGDVADFDSDGLRCL
jgi:hypothetical protein